MSNDYKTNTKSIDWILMLSIFGVWVAAENNVNSIGVSIFVVSIWATALACIKSWPQIRAQKNQRSALHRLIFCGLAGSIPPLFADFACLDEWIVISALVINLVHLLSLKLGGNASEATRSLGAPTSTQAVRMATPRISILIEMGPQIGTYKGQEIPQFVRTLDGRMLHFSGIASSYTSMEAEQVVLPPGIIYREDNLTMSDDC